MRVAFLAPGSAAVFPDPRRGDAEGLVAVGGDLAPARLLAAYARGIFPMYGEDMPILWWSPDPRAILPAGSLHCSRSLRRSFRRAGFRLTWDAAFRDVMLGCDEDRSDGRWIWPEMVEAYGALHRLGHAHSLEVWQGDALVGGIYGVQCGGLFAGESMFHRVTDASKVALVAAARTLFAAGIELFDVQYLTPHLASLGCVAVPREVYLRALGAVRARSVDLRGLVPRFADEDVSSG